MSQHSFAEVPTAKIQRSQFDRSFSIKDTFDFDYLVPIFVDEVLPGDTANVRANTFARLATQKVPIMDNMRLDYFFFYVPNRLVFSNWEKFNGAQDNPGDSTDYILPQMTIVAGNNLALNTLTEKMGIPINVGFTLKNTLPLRCYNLIWNEWFRDENLQQRINVPKDNGPDTWTDYVLRKRGKRHDYFTSATPWPQKGTSVKLPIGTSAAITGLAVNTGAFTTGPYSSLRSTSPSPYPTSYANYVTGGALVIEQDPNNVGFPNIRADLTTATAATINQLREAFALQSVLELDARGGTRYNELIQAHFRVTIPDFRLQRPEYLGGGTTKINSHPVANQSGTGTQAALAAFGTSSSIGADIGFSKSFVEHGYVIGLACARADITYQQGLNKMWDRSTRFDFYWPELANLGEQAIKNKEIYLSNGNAVQDEAVFGYQERYAEYRYRPSEIHGAFRSTYSTPIDQWHLAEKFASLPALNATFIQQSTPIARAIAVTTEPHLLFDCYYEYKHARPMPVYSVPGFGRF